MTPFLLCSSPARQQAAYLPASGSETTGEPVGGAPKGPIGAPDATREIAEHWIAGFPDCTFHLSHLIADDALVAALMPWTGTQTGPVLGLPPTGRPVHVGQIVIFRVVDGKITEAWEEWDEYRMRQQLGDLSASLEAAESSSAPRT